MNQRTAQIDRTRQAILDAALEAYLNSSDPSSLTMQALADSAGVSHRTLYRHFPSRNELVNEIGKLVDQRAAEEGGWQDPATFDEWVDGIEASMAFGAAHREQLRQGMIFGLGEGAYRTDRDEMYWGYFRERFPNLDDDTARQAFVCLRALHSSSNVVWLGERLDMSAEDLIPAVRFGVEVLIERIAEMDERAGEAS